MEYLLDTVTCIAVIRGREPTKSRVQACSPQDLAIATMTIAELEAGVHCASDFAAARARLDAFLHAPFERLPFDGPAAVVFGRLWAHLRGQHVGDRDLAIASVALVSGLTVVTENQRHFGRVPGLHVVNWAALESS